MKNVVLALALLTIPCTALAQDVSYGRYKGSGGMSAYRIKSNVYEYHYDKGFTGPDAMGWDPSLQYAWSRIAAAGACGVEIDKDKALASLETIYPQGKITHEMIGVGFHSAQIEANPHFCTESRIEELRQISRALEDGSFEKPFDQSPAKQAGNPHS